MELNVKDKVLLAIYKEYKKDLPNMEINITSKNLEMERDVFYIAIDKLQNEGLIEGASFSRSAKKILITYLNNVTITKLGRNYVETNLKNYMIIS